MSTIIKKYEGEISVDILEFSNMEVLDSLSERQLDSEEIKYLLDIASTYQPKEIRYSEVSDMDKFIKEVVENKKIGIIDESLHVYKSIKIIGNSKIIFQSGSFITFDSTVNNGFYLGSGSHEFVNYKTKHLNNVSGSHIYTEPSPNILWKNSIFGCIMEGGAYGYNSSRGGTESEMSTTQITDAFIDVETCCISVYSQDGPYKNLHLEHVTLRSKTSHNIYVHPAVSLDYLNVKTLGAGKLMQHQYSGTGNGGYGTGKYSRFRQIDSGEFAFEMTSLEKETPIIIEDSSIAPYTTAGVTPPMVFAKNTTFRNKGNGIMLRGLLEGCKGGVWSVEGHSLKIVDSDLTEIVFRGGGNITSINTKVYNVWGADRGKDFNLTFDNCKISIIYEGGSGNGYIYLKNTPIPSLSPNTFRKEIIKVI